MDCCCSVAKLCLFFVTAWTAALQASLFFTISQSLLKLMSIESVMLSKHLILCFPLLLLPSIFPSIRVLSNNSGLGNRLPKYWGFNFSISPFNDYSVLISFRIDWFDLLTVQETLKVCPSSRPLCQWCHLILWYLLLLSSIFPSIRDFSNKLAVHIRWPKYWSFSFSISPSIDYSGYLEVGCACTKSFQSYQTLCNPMDCCLPGSSDHGILQAWILDLVAISLSRGSSWPRDGTSISYIFCIGKWDLYQ